MIDSHGFRANVGIILCNDQGNVFWGKRLGQDAWQFPQGGVKKNESLEQALFRELHEETGLMREHVEILGRTDRWLRYRLPRRFIRRDCYPLCIGQKQHWFVLRLLAEENSVCLNAAGKPEFDDWRWVDYWYPAQNVIAFKRKVYNLALNELSHLLSTNEVESSFRVQP